MPRKFFRRYSPSREWLQSSRFLRPFAAILQDPALWGLSRKSSCRALGIGVFCAFLPVPFQTPLAVIAALYVRVNLPVTVLAVFVSNPLTIGPILWGSYGMGAFVLGMPLAPKEFEPSLGWALSELTRIWEPLLLGSLLLGSLAAVTSAVTVNLIWRTATVRHYRERKRRRRLRLPRLRPKTGGGRKRQKGQD